MSRTITEEAVNASVVNTIIGFVADALRLLELDDEYALNLMKVVDRLNELSISPRNVRDEKTKDALQRLGTAKLYAARAALIELESNLAGVDDRPLVSTALARVEEALENTYTRSGYSLKRQALLWAEALSDVDEEVMG